MSDTKEVTVEIADTEVTYEAAECASCGQQHNVDEMTPLLVGEYEYYHANFTYQFDDKPHKLYFCPYCVDEPLSVRVASAMSEILFLLMMVLLSMILGAIIGVGLPV